MPKATLLLIVLAVLLFTLPASCARSEVAFESRPDVQAVRKQTADFPQARFIVLSDLHYYDPSLGTSGDAFETYVRKDRKLLSLSHELLAQGVKQIIDEPADFVIVCGDLTKDGERINHEKVAAALGVIRDSGKPVYVIPGNHDVANGSAVAYTAGGTQKVPGLSGLEFAELYAPFGYGDALARDPESLSYLAEPKPGLWLLALDSCRWQENRPGARPVTEGAFSPKTLQWIETLLIRAKTEHKRMIAMLHHGLLAHYPSNADYFPQYLIADHDAVARMFASFGVCMVFSGHFHAQDITRKTYDAKGRFIIDVETGSLITFPCPYRVVSIDQDQKAHIRSTFITGVPSRPDDFQAYAENFVYDVTVRKSDAALSKFWIPEADRQRINPQVAAAYVAHLKGDEPPSRAVVDATGLSLLGKFILWLRGDLVKGWWTDLPPADNNVTLDLSHDHEHS